MSSNVVRVWGKADEFSLSFSFTGTYWEAELPKDSRDGKYIAELFAESKSGVVSYYTCILYLTHGRLLRCKVLKDCISSKATGESIFPVGLPTGFREEPLEEKTTEEVVAEQIHPQWEVGV